jgi:hypothetical protein
MILVDITKQVIAQQNIESVRGIEKVYNLVMNAPVIIVIVRGPEI